MNEKVDVIDGIFLSFSAVTSTGLSTVSMVDLSPASFAVLAILILCGGSLLLPLAPLLYRRFIYAKIKASYPSQFRIDNAPVLSEFDIQDRALLVMIRIIITYVAAVMFMGFLIIYAAMHLEEDDPELASRGYSREANAAFLSISAFNNAGYTLSSESVFHLQDNPVAYLTLALLILAGNTMAPVFYRLLIIAELFIRHSLDIKTCTVELQFILDNPRKVSVNTLPTREVIFLFITSTTLNIVQYLFYLGSSMWRESITDAYGSPTRLAGIGFFQTISTRNAGLQIMDLRTMNQGMLLVYAICMYLSGAPFVTALYASEDSSETTAKTTKTDTKDSGHTDTCATTDTFSGDEDGDGDGDGEEGADVGVALEDGDGYDGSEEQEETKSDSASVGAGTRLTRRGGFLLMAKAGKSEEAVTSATSATDTVDSHDDQTVAPEQGVETEDHGPRRDHLAVVGGGGGERELDAPLVGVLRRKSSFGGPGAESFTPQNTRRESRRGSTIARVADVIKANVLLEPTPSQVACALDIPERDLTLLQAPSTDPIRRRSSHTVTFDDNATAADGNLLFPNSVATADTCEASAGSSLPKSRRSSTGSLVVEQPPSSPSTAQGNGLASPSTLQLQGVRRRSSLVNLVGGGPPSSGAAMSRPGEGGIWPAHRPTISEQQYRALMRHGSVQLLNQRKFEIQNKFVETFIMKHSFFTGLGVFVCAFSEDLLMVKHPAMFNLWYIIFEVVSAYGNVGLSLSVPGQNRSLCGNFGVIGKLAIILIMLLGKHRGLPKEKDAVIDFKYRRLKRGVASLAAQIEARKWMSLGEMSGDEKV